MLTVQSHVTGQTSLLERIADARRRSDALFSIVRPASMYDRPIPERHRIIFYVGHLEAFDWNLLHDSVLDLKSFHPEFDHLFAFGIDPVDGGLPSDQPSDWPSLESVREYVSTIRLASDAKLARIRERHLDASDALSLDTLLNVAIEHRLMHVETLAYMLHQLPLDRKVRQGSSPDPATDSLEHGMVEIPDGTATLGMDSRSEKFGWDNEFEAHEVHVPAFEIDRYPVTNGKYLDFIAAGGYDERALWREEDWKWTSEQGISHPAFWKRTSEGWLLRTMFDEIPLPLDWPVYVSHAEASAYALWIGKSLPTEEQWHRAAYGAADGRERTYPWGEAAPAAKLGNFDFQRWDPAPVNAFPQGQSAFGVHDLLGNGWEWTSSKFSPFPGFEAFPFYPGYSANFFDGKHFVMKGGSARTAVCMLRPTFRNWFQPHYQYVYAGFRCVRD